MKNSIFETKEQYLAFRNAFALAVNDKRAKSTRDKLYGSKIPGWIKPEYFILLNIIRGKNPDYGFTPLTNENKIKSGYPQHPMRAYKNAMYRLADRIGEAQRVISRSVKSAYEQQNLEYTIANNSRKSNTFLEPFAGTLTIEQLAKLTLPIEV